MPKIPNAPIMLVYPHLTPSQNIMADNPLKKMLALLDDLRDSMTTLVPIMEQLDGEAQAKREQEDYRNATVEDTLPSQQHSFLTPYLHTMTSLQQARPLLSHEQWQVMLKEHQRYLDHGGLNWPGEWTSLVQSDVTFGSYNGSPATEGSPLDLHLHRLDEANLDATGADLRHAHMCGVSANELDFEEADLTRVYATDALFRGANFQDADLTYADFSRSDMSGANFQNADLSFTDFEGCNLTNADFTGATLRGTRFPSAVLTGAISPNGTKTNT